MVAARPNRRDGAHDQAGESLVELLVTISIVSICVIGLVAALGANFAFSRDNAEVTHGHEILARYAEAIAAEPYAACTDGPPYANAAVTDIPSTNLPDGATAVAPGLADNTDTSFALSIESVHFWNGDATPATFGGTCPSTDPGYQQVVLRATAGDGSYTESMTIYKRQP